MDILRRTKIGNALGVTQRFEVKTCTPTAGGLAMFFLPLPYT